MTSSPGIIFVPGMRPKPPPEDHRRALCRVLTAAVARVSPQAAPLLEKHSECLALVSWTYGFYGTHRDIALDLPGIERLLREPEPSEEDIAEIDSKARRLTRLWHVLGDALPMLGRLMAKPEMRLTMTEALQYLGDIGGVASDTRAMLKRELRRAWRKHERVLLIGHSLGSVIAYDALWELSHLDEDDGRVDLLMTLGSPLATRFIHRRLRGHKHRGRHRYPTNIRRWVNFSAKGDMTALHPALKPFFREMIDLGLVESIEDHVDLYNHFHGSRGLNVHQCYGYLAHPAVAGTIGEWLQEEGEARDARASR